MNNTINLLSIVKQGNRLEFDYEVKGEWRKYFDLENKLFIEYSFNIEDVPDSVAVIPLIGNILPMAWLCDAEIILDELDQDFYKNLNAVKKGYMDMYSMLDFTGKVTVSSIVNNQKKKCMDRNNAAAFFSGGVDAYTTLLRHIEEKPLLMVLWGADIKLQDTEGWGKVTAHIQSVSDAYKLNWVCVRTNFREMINEGELESLVNNSGDGWWHGFQCGIAIISHAAPIAYAYGMERAYIASSFPEKMKGQYTCASDPTIDNNIEYCGCKTVHDGYELDRQEKIRYLVSKKAEGNPINLRVCWESSGGGNCCRCEKCYRTILEIVSEGDDPNHFGFSWGDKDIIRCRRDLKNKIRMNQFNWDQFYFPIQEMMKRNSKSIINVEKYQWLQKIDFSRINNTPMKVLRYSYPVRGVKKIVRIIKAGRLKK